MDAWVGGDPGRSAATGTSLMPHSPRWLMEREREDEAREVLKADTLSLIAFEIVLFASVRCLTVRPTYGSASADSRG